MIWNTISLIHKIDWNSRERKKTLKTIKIFHFEVEWLCLLDFFSTVISLNLDWLQFSKWVYRSINQFDTVNRNVILYPNIVHLPKCICPANTSVEFFLKKMPFCFFFSYPLCIISIKKSEYLKLLKKYKHEKRRQFMQSVNSR